MLAVIHMTINNKLKDSVGEVLPCVYGRRPLVAWILTLLQPLEVPIGLTPRIHLFGFTVPALHLRGGNRCRFVGCVCLTPQMYAGIFNFQALGEKNFREPPLYI